MSRKKFELSEHSCTSGLPGLTVFKILGPNISHSYYADALRYLNDEVVETMNNAYCSEQENGDSEDGN